MLHLDMILIEVFDILNSIWARNAFFFGVRLQGEKNIMLRKDRIPSDDRGFIIFLICFILLFLSVMLYVRI